MAYKPQGRDKLPYRTTNTTDQRHPNTGRGGRVHSQVVNYVVEVPREEMRNKVGEVISHATTVKIKKQRTIYHRKQS